MYLVSKLVDLLPRSLRPFAKAVIPAGGALLAVGVQWASTGRLDTAELVTAIVGLVAAAVSFLVPNKPA